ncbi:MAG: FAD binding domain-containing protein [Aggregatilineales bacterium]|nr:FAD binding domain-containing protein [Aggregatilineales bacterium]
MAIQAYFLPETVDEAVSLLAEYGPDLLVMAGGTLAMPLINEGVSMPAMVMGLRRAGLDGVGESNGRLAIGATATMTQMLAQDAVPMLREAARAVGGWAVRNMATVGGNLFAPPPSGDFAVALLALDAEVHLLSQSGARTIPLEEFYTGFMTTALQPGELVTGFHVPRPTGRTVYLKAGRKHANTPAVVTVAAQVVMDNGTVTDARIALNAVGPHPMRARSAEAALIGQPLDEAAIHAAAEAAMQESQPFTDAIASEWYRRRMTGVTVRRALTQLAS